MKNLFSIILAGILFAGCSSSDDNKGEGPLPPEVDGLLIEVSTTNPRVYESIQLVGWLYIGDTVEDVSSQMSCSTFSTILRITEENYIIGTRAGSAELECSYDGYSRKVNFQIEGAAPQSTRIVPEDNTMHRGTSSQWRYIATYADGAERDLTHTVDWSVSNESLASVKNGLVQALSTGYTFVETRHEFLPTGQEQLIVIYEPPLSIDIVQNELLYVGVTRNFSAYGNWADGDRARLNGQWSSSNGSLINKAGSSEFAAIKEGDVIVSFEYEGVQAERDFYVNEFILTDVVTELDSERIVVGERAFIRAMAHYSDGREVDISGIAEWHQGKVNDPLVEFILDPGSNVAMIEGLWGSSQTSIWADYDKVSGSKHSKVIIVERPQ